MYIYGRRQDDSFLQDFHYIPTHKSILGRYNRIFPFSVDHSTSNPIIIILAQIYTIIIISNNIIL